MHALKIDTRITCDNLKTSLIQPLVPHMAPTQFKIFKEAYSGEPVEITRLTETVKYTYIDAGSKIWCGPLVRACDTDLRRQGQGGQRTEGWTGARVRAFPADGRSGACAARIFLLSEQSFAQPVVHDWFELPVDPQMTTAQFKVLACAELGMRQCTAG